MNLDSVYLETSCRITHRPICGYPTAHHTPQHAFAKQRRLLPRYFAGSELPVPPQNQPAKHEYSTTATYYTAKTSIRQAIFEQKSCDSKKNFRRVRGDRKVLNPGHTCNAGKRTLSRGDWATIPGRRREDAACLLSAVQGQDVYRRNPTQKWPRCGLVC